MRFGVLHHASQRNRNASRSKLSDVAAGFGSTLVVLKADRPAVAEGIAGHDTISVVDLIRDPEMLALRERRAGPSTTWGAMRSWSSPRTPLTRPLDCCLRDTEEEAR